MKNHAKDYLIEFANENTTKDWLRLLINKVILTNGDIVDSEKECIYQLLKADTTSTIPQIPVTSSVINNKTIILKQLVHHSGVCALRKGQTINFSHNITILWGLNGSGKSSYFKILNEIVGGNMKKEIKSNIYLDSHQPINVDITYNESSCTKSLHWDDIQNRSIQPLNVIRVFDSSYLSGLLTKRTADETVVNPYGLNLFSKLSESIDSFKQLLHNEMDDISQNLPIIEVEKLGTNIKTIISEQKYTKDQKMSVTSLYNCTQETRNNIKKISDNIENIMKTDYGAKIKYVSHNKDIIEKIKNDIKNSYDNYIEDIHNVQELIYEYNWLAYESKKVKDSTSILKSIGNTNSNAWKDFIKAGENYKKEDNFDEGICPYCHQHLNQEASNIIHAYSAFLNNKSEMSLSLIKDKIDEKLAELRYKKYDFATYKDSIYIQEKNHEDIDMLFQKIVMIDKFLDSQRTLLIDYLLDKIFPSILFDDKSIIPDFDGLINKYNQDIIEYKLINKQRDAEIERLKKHLFLLRQNEYISDNQLLFDDWFTKIDAINRLKTINNRASTRKITELSDTAFNELITENLKKEFNYQLQDIGLNQLSVDLQPAGKSKGSVNMIMKLNNNDVNGILSEGEQKGVGLALFIAESKMQHSCNPIIFDDPVNSLDHKIAVNFANILMKLDNQIIIFTHDVLFLDAFECSHDNHICKISNGTCQKNKGKHIYLYQVQSEGKNDKGVIIPKEQNSSEVFIRKAKYKLNQPTFTEPSETAAYLRNAIERIIDEKIFNNQVPTRYSNKNSRINWNELKNLNNNDTMIDNLNKYHSRLSGGDLHNGTESTENPIEKEEFERIVEYLESL